MCSLIITWLRQCEINFLNYDQNSFWQLFKLSVTVNSWLGFPIKYVRNLVIWSSPVYIMKYKIYW